MLLLKSR